MRDSATIIFQKFSDATGLPLGASRFGHSGERESPRDEPVASGAGILALASGQRESPWGKPVASKHGKPVALLLEPKILK